MNTWTLIPITFLLSAGAGFVAARMAVQPAAEAGSTEEAPAVLSRIQTIADTLTRLEEKQAELTRSMNGKASSELRMPTQRVAVGDLDAAIEDWMLRNGERMSELQPELAAATKSLAASNSMANRDLDDIMNALLQMDGPWEDQDLWEEIRKSGRIDEVVAEFERIALDDPSNPDAQYALGGAYLQQLFEVGASPAAGELAMKADQAFDNALELDPNHWEARFSKAVALSNWPAFLGKTGEAINQFQTLIDQQGDLEPQGSHAQSFLFLGNLYQQTGELEKARDAWREGLTRFPDNETLRLQLEVNSDE